VLPIANGAIGIAAGFPLRISDTEDNVQSIQRGPRLPMPLVNSIVKGAESTWIAGGIPGQRGVLSVLNELSLESNMPMAIGQECLTGYAEVGGRQVVVNAKGALFSRTRNDVWQEQPAHQGACTGILAIRDRGFVTFGVDALVHCWDRNSSKTATLEGHSAAITSGMVMADGTLITVSLDRSVRVWDPVRQRQKKFIKGFEKALVAVHLVGDSVVIIDSVGQVFTIGDSGKPVKAGAAPGYPCCSWVTLSPQASVCVALRNGTIHRIPIGV
jgi:hypothetical protein